MKILIVEGNNQPALALNSALEGCDIVLCYELPAGTEPPAEMLMVPPGPWVEGRDGRSWANSDPQAIVRFFQERGLKIPLDIEHATELKAPKGEPAPAMAWGTSLEARADGSVWAHMEWNPRGREMVTNKEYSYYSPAYVIDKSTGTIIGIKSIGLTNNPNLRIPALNHQNHKEDHMNLAALLAALGLASTATFEDALNHITKLKGDLTTALNRADSPPLDRFVPKADYDLVVNRANDAEGKLKEQAKAVLETAINTEIDAALKAGKITPGTKEYHVEQCRQEGGLERFKAFVAAAPTVADNTDLDRKKPGDQGTVLNAEEKAACLALGISEADYIKANQE